MASLTRAARVPMTPPAVERHLVRGGAGGRRVRVDAGAAGEWPDLIERS